MVISKYLKEQLVKSSEINEAQSRRTLISVVILAILAVGGYIVISSADPQAASTAVIFSGIFGVICLVFFVKYLRLRKPIGDNVYQRCEQEIKKNLKDEESFETFDDDMFKPAFGVHAYISGTVTVGKKFILFHRMNANGPKFQIIRGDALGEIKVYYSSNAGMSQDIGLDLKDKKGKLIRSVIFQDKKSLYKLVDALEKIKNYNNGDTSAVIEAEESYEDPFVAEAKEKIAATDRSSITKLAIVGLVVGAFLSVSGGGSGIVFIYSGIILITISLVGLIYNNVRKKIS
ncbi:MULTISPECIES: hypothetical protein [unclassified Clostridium]|uniref:hypothetical protein n=1 Tax=unclassified Clostridium TaxID=2614128 RepID=UPI0002977E82|nr:MULTISPECIES: hypothetical protein [unclassified Clostridium]EKQ50965.1 MAG: hypothetical protein A370_05247 [Clostridium sp. Maddingley MBC34-26]